MIFKRSQFADQTARINIRLVFIQISVCKSELNNSAPKSFASLRSDKIVSQIIRSSPFGK